MSDTSDTRRELLERKLAALPTDCDITFRLENGNWFAYWTAIGGVPFRRYLGPDVDGVIETAKRERVVLQREYVSYADAAPHKPCAHTTPALYCSDCIAWAYATMRKGA